MSRKKKDNNELMGTCTQIVDGNKTIDKMLADSLSIYDQALYFIRQDFFKKPLEERDICKYKIMSKSKLNALVKNTKAFKDSDLDYHVKQRAAYQARESFADWKEAMKEYRRNPADFTGEPSIPHYMHLNKKYNKITVHKTRFRYFDIERRVFRLPCSEVEVYVPEYVKIENIKTLTVTKYYDKYQFAFNYVVDCLNVDNKLGLDYSSCIGIDPGVNNLLAITTNDKDSSLIINGRQVKAINQLFNKKLSKLNSELPLLPKEKRTEYVTQVKGSKAIFELCEKHSNQIRTICNTVAKMVIDFCLAQKSGTIVVGRNKGWKIGGMKNRNKQVEKANNQNFINMPIAKILDRIKHLAQRYGIQYIEVEESHTSKTDHLMFEEMKHFDDDKQRSGRRVHRGLFKSGCGVILNADINGAIGILRKANVLSIDQLMDMRNRGSIVRPVVKRLFAKTKQSNASKFKK